MLPIRPPRVLILAVHHVHHNGHCLLGGAEKYIRDTVRRLLAAGARVHVAYSGDSIYDDIAREVDDPRRLILERTNWLDANLSGDRRLNPRLVLSRARWFRNRDPDVVFVVQQGHGTAFGASIVGAALAGYPVVMSIRQPAWHGPPARELETGMPGACNDSALSTQPLTNGSREAAPSGLRPRPFVKGQCSAFSLGLWRYRPILRMRAIARCCRTIIFNSRRVADQYVDRYGIQTDRIVIIPNGEPLARRPRFERPACLESHGQASSLSRDSQVGWHGQATSLVTQASSSCHSLLVAQANSLCRPGHSPVPHFVIGAVGQVAHHKGADLTFDAFAAIAERFPSARLIYFGDGPLMAPLAARARSLGLSHRVTFAGHVADRDAMFDQIDLLVMASRRESSSNAVAEAMARGLPCIVSDSGGLPELIEHNVSGMVVRAGRADLLAAAIERLLHDPDLSHRLAAAAYPHAARHHDPATNGFATIHALIRGA